MIRPVDAPRSQTFGENPTKNLPWNSWLIQTFGNYQPDGHSGEDYACDVGTPVRAVTSGTVLHIGWMGGTYDQNPWWIAPNFAGYCAVIDHGSFIGIYGHCQDGSAKVRKGDRVAEGQVFILSGNTGGSTGPHLHFEILPDGYILQSAFYGRIDPEPLFRSTITTQSATITPLSEEDDMTQAEKDALFEAIARIDRKADEVHARVFGRDVQRWFNPATGDVVFDARDGYIPARSTDVHDVISTNNLVVAQTDKILDAVSKIPGVDVSIISGLREQLAAELKKVTEGLQVTLAVKEEVK